MEFKCNPFEKFDKEWALVSAGKPGDYNTMTISWGSMGTIWNKSIITVYVRPERYTHSFLMKNDVFSISFFEEEYRKSLTLLGTKSGRDGDKVKEANLTPIFEDETVKFKQAYQTIICKKIYVQQLDKDAIPEDSKFFYGENGEVHYMFIGEIIKII